MRYRAQILDPEGNLLLEAPVEIDDIKVQWGDKAEPLPVQINLRTTLDSLYRALELELYEGMPLQLEGGT